jgi:hypothetical protein
MKEIGFKGYLMVKDSQFSKMDLSTLEVLYKEIEVVMG